MSGVKEEGCFVSLFGLLFFLGNNVFFLFFASELIAWEARLGRDQIVLSFIFLFY
jgi:hypothetical protein